MAETANLRLDSSSMAEQSPDPSTVALERDKSSSQLPLTKVPEARERVHSSDDSHGSDFMESLSRYHDSTEQLNVCQRVKEYVIICIEGDLAGFQLAWICMSCGFLVMKMANITDVVQTIQWWAIFVIPIANALLTGWFDFIIRKYRSTLTKESLKKARFVGLWTLKIVFALYVTTYWIWGPDSFMHRYRGRPDYKGRTACNIQVGCVYVSVLVAVAMSEMMITTVLINSEQNLSLTRTPMGYRLILLVIRPFVWVYNRTMVMFLCFYAIYGLMYTVFFVGLVADKFCDSSRCAETQKVGLQMLLVPFTVPNYLMQVDQVFKSWNGIRDEDFLETFVVVFLCQSFYVDCLNSLWQFSRRYLKPKQTKQRTLHGSPQTHDDRQWMNELAKELPPSPLPNTDDTTSTKALK